MGSTVDFRPCRECYCLAARRRARAITRLYDQKLRPHGLRSTQYSVLAALALKGPTCVTQLADLLGLERTTLTRIGAVLARDGLVSVEPSGDGRERLLALTSTGRRKLERAFAAWKEAQDLVGRQLARSLWPGDARPANASRGGQ